ncbi:hypothetical protein [Clostridium taeniosporum]|uniref:Uncharacterized protein n=1 Tax=Clostridium taeniosporum TaxID=394958 RepID=A0A1D7XP94_9CLOT|nr:hypothetical protein [Clostridium taeniosporum]AOR25117.1 hypothetical protein BGI42_15350 [Clostridium taeniosporum]
MITKRPLLVTFIGDLNLFNAFLLIISLFPTPKFLEQYITVIPICDLKDFIIRILMIISLLIISYGFFKLKKWGYWLMIGYNLFFLVISIIGLLTKNNQLGNYFIGSLLALIVTFPSKQYFIKII